MHAHDVRGLAIWPPYRPLPERYQRPFNLGISPVLASAGLDMSIVLTPCAAATTTAATNTTTQLINPLAASAFCNFEDAYYHRMPYTSAMRPVLFCARRARLLMCVKDKSVSVYRILEREIVPISEALLGMDDLEGNDESASAVKKEAGGYEKLFDMDILSHTNLTTGAISDDGKWMAISDRYEVKLFALDRHVRIYHCYYYSCVVFVT